jgi:hypothetical protein
MMADYRAVSVVCEAVLRQLRLSYKPELFNQQRLEFKVCLASDLISRGRTIRAGVTLFLYHVSPNAARRNAPPPRAGDGRLEPPALQLDLRFLLTAWAREANTQQAILGWVMRRMEDQPILPAAVLNNIAPPSFQPEETVEILLDELSSLDLIRIWEKSVRSPYQLSIPYIARNIAIATFQSE